MNETRKITHNFCKWECIKFIFYTHQCKTTTIKFCKFKLLWSDSLHVNDLQRYAPNVHRFVGDTPEWALRNGPQFAKLSTTRTHSAPGI